MLTPDNSQTVYSMRPCERPDCTLYIPTKENRIYHDDKCRWLHTNFSRKSISRLRKKAASIAVDEQFLAFLVQLENIPPTLADRLDARWQELMEFDMLLYRYGPVPWVRQTIEFRANAIRLGFFLEPPKTSDEVYQYVQCLKIIVDLGADKPSDVPRLRQYAWEIVLYYFYTNNRLSLSRAFMTYAHNWRLDNHPHQARHNYSHAYNILEEYRGVQNKEYFRLLHIATRWHFRSLLEIDKLDKDKLDQAEGRFMHLADKVGTPQAWLETHCQLAGLWARGGRYQDRALSHYQKVEHLQRMHTFPEYGRLSLLRAKIHALLETKDISDRQNAKDVIEHDFLPLYERDRHFYYHNFLEALKRNKILDLSFSLSPALYGSGILIYLPRN